MEPSCKDCGQHHDTFLDGVVCDVEHYGTARTRERLLKFCTPAIADDLIEQASLV